MREYTFISKGRAEGVVVDVDLPKKISAISLKKAIAKFSPKELCTMAVIYWTSRKGNESKKVITMPYINRKQEKVGYKCTKKVNKTMNKSGVMQLQKVILYLH